MATAAVTRAGLSAKGRTRARPRFYFHLSLFCLAFGLLGFAPTYFAQVPLGTFRGTPLLHIHALLATAWLALLASQSWQAARGRLDHHRAWGLAGIALATLILASGIAIAIVGLQERYAQGRADEGRAFFIAPIAAVAGFYGFFVAAMANIRRLEWHRRLIFVATAVMLLPAAARFFFLVRNGWEAGLRPGSLPPAPVAATMAGIVAICIVPAVGAIYDWRRRGQVHPAWWIGLGAILIGGYLRIPLSRTTAWHAFADWTTRLT